MAEDKTDNQPPGRRRFFTLKEGAAYMEVDYYWLIRRIGKPGGPPHQRRGAQWRLPREEFIKWAEQPYIP